MTCVLPPEYRWTATRVRGSERRAGAPRSSVSTGSYRALYVVLQARFRPIVVAEAATGKHESRRTCGGVRQRHGQLHGQRHGPSAAGEPPLAPAARGSPVMLAPPAPRRNAHRPLRARRSDNRGESEVRGALRARAGTAALLGCAQARRLGAARAVARAVARPVAACGSFIGVAAIRGPAAARS